MVNREQELLRVIGNVTEEGHDPKKGRIDMPLTVEDHRVHRTNREGIHINA